MNILNSFQNKIYGINQSNCLQLDSLIIFYFLILNQRYYFSAFEDDNLLCILNDNTYSQDEAKIKVIPEQYSVDSVSQVLNLDLKNLKL